MQDRLHTPRVGFDARYLSHGLTGGVRTYAYHLCARLPALAPHWEFVWYADAKRPFEVPAPLPPNVTLRTLPWRSPASSVLNDWRIARWLERDRVDLAHFPANTGPRGSYVLIVTVHDSLNLFPMRAHWKGFGRSPRAVAMMWYLGRRTWQAVRQADHLLTDSEYSRRDIAERAGLPMDRLTAVHLAADPEFTVLEDSERLGALRERWRLGPLTILADGIKNPATTLAAWASLPESLLDRTVLAFFSREDTPRPAVQAALADPRVRFIPRPTKSELVGLMNVATVLAYPSFYEGFGLGLVEAMMCGLPVVASSRACIPEVVGDGGLIFDLESAPAFSAQLAQVLGSAEARERLRRAALARAATFGWDLTARRTLQVYDDVLVRLGRPRAA